MQTESHIVYSILEIVNKGEISDDKKIDERVIRGFLQAYRPAAIAKYSVAGHTISDECFQYLGELDFAYLKPRHFVRVLPAIIRLQFNYGLIFEKNGERIPILNSENFTLSLKSIINGRLPKAKFLGTKATLYIGEKKNTTCGQKPNLNQVMDDFNEQIINTVNESVSIDVHAVLDNPDDCPTYDWTRDPYPMPSELIDQMRTQILQKEFNIILQVKTDKVTDGNDSDTKQEQKV